MDVERHARERDEGLPPRLIQESELPKWILRDVAEVYIFILLYIHQLHAILVVMSYTYFDYSHILVQVSFFSFFFVLLVF